MIHHGGDDNAHHSMLIYFPEFEGAVITQSNNDFFDSGLAIKIANIYFKEEFKNSEAIKNGEYDVTKFEKLVGEYALDESPDFILNFMKDGKRIYTQATGQTEVDLIAESDSVFKIKGVDARVKFNLNEDGTAHKLVLMQNGLHTATKISSEKTSEEFVYKTSKFDKLAGKYILDDVPSFFLKFWREKDRLYSQGKGQSEVAMIAESDSVFKIKGVDAKVKFHIKKNGTADKITLMQNGAHTATRVSAEEKNRTNLDEYTGTFYSKEIETVYHVIINEGSLEISSFLFPENIVLSHSTEDLFTAGYPLESLKFQRNEKDTIVGFSITNGRTRGVKFDKMRDDF